MAGCDEAAAWYSIILRSYRYGARRRRPNRSATELGNIYRRQPPDGVAQRRYRWRFSFMGQVPATIRRSRSGQYCGGDLTPAGRGANDPHRRNRAGQLGTRGEPQIQFLSRYRDGRTRTVAAIAAAPSD